MTVLAAAIPAKGPIGMTEEDDLALVKRTTSGDVEAFGELVRRHEQIVYNLAFRFVRDPDRAEDMAQEAFLKAFRLLDGFRGDCNFSTWLYRVTCSVCLTELRRLKRRREVALEPRHVARAAAERQGPSEEQELIRHCVSKLPERYAAIITLYYLRGIPYEEIAEIMEVPLGTLKTWMHRARRQLKQMVEKELAEYDVDASE